MARGKNWLAAGGVVAGGFLALELAMAVPLTRVIGHLVDAMRHAGALGAALYAGTYVAFALLLIPGSLLTAGADRKSTRLNSSHRT